MQDGAASVNIGLYGASHLSVSLRKELKSGAGVGVVEWGATVSGISASCI